MPLYTFRTQDPDVISYIEDSQLSKTDAIISAIKDKKQKDLNKTEEKPKIENIIRVESRPKGVKYGP